MLLTTLILLIKQKNGLQINVKQRSFYDVNMFCQQTLPRKIFSFTKISFDVSDKALTSMKIAESGRRRRPRGCRKQKVNHTSHMMIATNTAVEYIHLTPGGLVVLYLVVIAQMPNKKNLFCHSIRFCFQSISLASERKLSKNLPRRPTEAF